MSPSDKATVASIEAIIRKTWWSCKRDGKSRKQFRQETAGLREEIRKIHTAQKMVWCHSCRSIVPLWAIDGYGCETPGCEY